MSDPNRMPRPIAVSWPDNSPQRRAPRHWICPLGAFPPMRMPRDAGGYLVTQVEIDPSGACAGFTAAWHPRLDPVRTGQGDLVLQLHAPDVADEDEAPADQRVAVSLWLAREDRWARMRCWPDAGAGWPQQVAPWIHAALVQTRRPHPAGQTPPNARHRGAPARQ